MKKLTTFRFEEELLDKLRKKAETQKRSLNNYLECVLEKMTVQEAMLLLYNSDTYTRLVDAGSGLYYQSPRYVMDCLDNEVTTGRCF